MKALGIAIPERTQLMEIRPIRTDKDHRATLAEIEASWGAREGTEAGDRLDVLLALVEIYEAKRWPVAIDESFDPIDVLNYAIDELGHTQAELATQPAPGAPGPIPFASSITPSGASTLSKIRDVHYATLCTLLHFVRVNHVELPLDGDSMDEGTGYRNSRRT